MEGIILSICFFIFFKYFYLKIQNKDSKFNADVRISTTSLLYPNANNMLMTLRWQPCVVNVWGIIKYLQFCMEINQKSFEKKSIKNNQTNKQRFIKKKKSIKYPILPKSLKKLNEIPIQILHNYAYSSWFPSNVCKTKILLKFF